MTSRSLSAYRTLLLGAPLLFGLGACALVANLSDERKPFPTAIVDSGADVAETEPEDAADGSSDGPAEGSRDGAPDADADADAEAGAGLLGMGYDMLQATLLPPCVTYDAAIDEPDAGAPHPTFQITTFSSTRELRDALELSPAEHLANEVTRNDPRGNYVTANPVDETIGGLAIAAKAARLVTTAHAPRLTDAAAALLASDRAKFRKVCGDAFVASVEAQSAFRAVLRVPTYGTADLLDVRGAPSSALTIDELIATLGNRAIDVWSYNEGAFGANAQACTDLACVRNAVNAVLADPQLVHTAGRPIFATYATLPNVPQGADLTPALEALGAIADGLGRSRDNAASLVTILAHPTRFAPFDAAQLTTERARLAAEEPHFQKAAVECAKGAATCAVPPDDPHLQVPIPARFEPVNLVADPGFEKQTTQGNFDGTLWSGLAAGDGTGSGADVQKGYARTGANNGFAVEKELTSATGKIGMATAIALDPHTRYAVRAWLFVSNTDEAEIALKTNCAEKTQLSGIYLGTVHHPNWELRSFELDSGDLTSASLCIGFDARWDSAARYIQVDDVTVVKLPL